MGIRAPTPHLDMMRRFMLKRVAHHTESYINPSEPDETNCDVGYT